MLAALVGEQHPHGRRHRHRQRAFALDLEGDDAGGMVDPIPGQPDRRAQPRAAQETESHHRMKVGAQRPEQRRLLGGRQLANPFLGFPQQVLGPIDPGHRHLPRQVGLAHDPPQEFGLAIDRRRRQQPRRLPLPLLPRLELPPGPASARHHLRDVVVADLRQELVADRGDEPVRHAIGVGGRRLVLRALLVVALGRRFERHFVGSTGALEDGFAVVGLDLEGGPFRRCLRRLAKSTTVEPEVVVPVARPLGPVDGHGVTLPWRALKAWMSSGSNRRCCFFVPSPTWM
jgi:hypothetical protein